jgi:hypothetical protein
MKIRPSKEAPKAVLREKVYVRRKGVTMQSVFMWPIYQNLMNDITIHMVQKSIRLGTLKCWAVAFRFAFGLSVRLSETGNLVVFCLESPLCECWCVACVALLLARCIDNILIWLCLLLSCLLLHYCLATCLCLLLCFLSCLRVYKKMEQNQGQPRY